MIVTHEKRPAMPAFRVDGPSFGSAASGNRTAGHFANQMRPIIGGCVDIAHQPIARYADAIDCGGAEIGVKRGFKIGCPEHAIITGAGHRDADAIGEFGDKHADHGIA